MDYFEQLGCPCRLVKNDVTTKDLPLDGIQGVVISPGPETPEKANHLMSMLGEVIGRFPVLGICLGHQAIALHYGAKLSKAPRPMHGKLSKITTNGGLVFKTLPLQFEVVRYHSLIIEDLPASLTPTALTIDGLLMAFESKSEKVCGVQFHPEAALTEYGLKIFRNWLTFIILFKCPKNCCGTKCVEGEYMVALELINHMIPPLKPSMMATRPWFGWRNCV